MATPNKPGGLMSSGQPVPARTGVGSGSTVHHMATTTATGTGLSPARTTQTPFANLQQGILAMSMQAAQKTASPVVSSQTSLRPGAPVLTPRGPTSQGPSPRKKIKVEEVEPATEEIAVSRRLILDERLSQMHEIKQDYIDHLTECFFLQQGGQMMDFYQWRKKPTPQLLHFLKSGMLDSDDEEDSLLKYLPDRRSLDSEVKVSSVGGILPISTPVATSTTLPASVAALSQQGSISARVGVLSTVAGSHVGAGSSIHRSVSDSRLATLSAQSTKTIMTTSPSGASIKKTPPGSPGRQRQNSFDGTNIKGISSQEAIVERAKQEAQVMSRVAELRKEGLWSSRRLPKVQEPPRNKAHWDYLLEEMQWLAADFQQERKWKKTCARKIAKMVQKYFQDIEQKELRAEKEETMKLKRTAAQLAKMVKEFWSNIEKVVQYKQNSRLDEKRKKAMDLHLNFIVDQTEKYSSWLSEGLTGQTSTTGSLNTTPTSSLAGDEEFRPEESESDDEETIDKDEAGIDEEETKDEVEALQKESELPLDQLIESLPKEILEKPASLDQLEDTDDQPEADRTKKSDEDFNAESDESDVEETIDEQEEHEDKHEQKKELDELKDEGEMDIEELRAKYAAAYEIDMPVDSGEESTDIDQSDDEADEDSDDEEEDEDEEEEEAEVDVEGGEDVGLEALVQEDTSTNEIKPRAVKEEDERDKALTDIAAQAASLQPKGYTLESAEVKTTVPFLLRHTLREYQHVGLDWLATMYEKRLNGILADEMGLGKTIQTIALLAHLACEKGIWGPHLIVVPTSVMLNWEMEIKKWCPSFKILTYYGSQKERKQKRMGWTKTNAFHICITSYKLVIQDHQSFRRKKWKYLILDEAQNIKNFKSQRWQTLLNFNSMRRLLLTGTPLQNSLMELWSLMHFLMPNVFQSHKDFKEWFANPLTGMIEGSHEYNESLIRRLHKVLRPFLLRRLKDDVEKQMPKKYEHIVMCHLSKRQRFLYDEFMAQGKTKETLATGHFMSVINILMQLRKVCNHPSLFDPRPIVSPLQVQGLTYHTASLVLQVFKDNPLEKLDLHHYPGLADMERDLPAFIAHRVRKLQTGRKLIEEIDIAPPPPARPPPGKLKLNAIRCVSPALQTGRASPMVGSRSASPATVTVAGPTTTTATAVTPSTPRATVNPVINTTTVTMVTSAGGQVTSTPASSQPITVQIQHTDQGTRLVVPSGQLSSLPGFIQIVQTSTGQHLIATSAPSIVSTATSATVVVNGSPVVTMATTSARPVVSTATSQLKMAVGIQSTVTTAQSVAATSSQQPKPVMWVSPLATTTAHSNGDNPGYSTAKGAPKSFTKVTYSSQLLKHWEKEKIMKQKKDPFFLESVYDKEQRWHRERLQFISQTNHQHCEVKPVYGQDLREAINIFRDPYSSRTYRNRDISQWHGPGYIHCQCAKLCPQPHHPKYVWNQVKVLSNICHSPEQYLEEMAALLERFVFVIPTVQSPPIQMHTSHPPPSYRRDEVYRDYMLRSELSPRATNYHQISTKMTVQFPELRLIQYDCGKLQTLDILLRRLKSGDHRVLIFTQMTRMLDILECFLSYHGHRYLRLDGTTRVEQRQMLMDRFNADRRIFVFILSTRSGGIGVNLTGADTVIFYDSDWNPTMDAQAQDRCHRIGQTRDVHIYRLVSEKTVEENILKKANQKRMLGDMAIEGGNFTTAFFKQNTISELFSEPSGLESLVKEKEQEEREKKEKEEKAEKEKQERLALQQFEKALAENEDETDVVAIEQVKAEQKAELAEFDENIPWDEKEAELREDESHVEQELAMLHNELTPIERYAVQYMEEQMEPMNQEELLVAEEDIEAVKKDWELNRLKALKEEEERRAEMEEDEMLYTYSRDDAYQQVFLSDLDKEQMPIWAPPTPPHDDNDVYMDETLLFLYEPTVMPETQLPPVYVKKERKKIKVESITTRKQKQRKEEQPRVPRSLFDRPTAQLLKLRREKMKMSQMKPYRPIQNLPPKPPMEQTPDHPEWLIHEDWALLQAVQNFFDVSLNLMIVNPAHTPNWDMVADVVNGCSRVYRSPKQCRLRYENVIIPREEGRIMYDINPRKQKKQKGIYKLAKRCQAMKTGQIHSQDSNNGLTILYNLRFDSVKSIATKRPPTMRQTLVNPTLKNPKHASVLQENSITYDQPLSPMQVAEIRAQRIQREKKQQQAAQQAASEQATVTTSAVTTIQRPGQLAAGQAAGQQVTAPTIVAMTTAVSAAQLATIVTAASSATVLTVSGTPLAQATLRQRAPLTMQELSASGIVGPVRAQLQTSTTTVATGLTPVQLAQRISAANTGVQQQQLQQATKTAFTQQQFQILHNPNIFKQKPSQQQQQQQAVIQQHQLKQRPLTLPTALTQQQQLRHLKAPVIQGQKTVIAQQLVTSMAQPGQLKTATGTTRPLTQEDLARLKQQQLNQQKVVTGQAVVGSSVAQLQAGQLQTPQIIAATQFQPVTPATLSKMPQTVPTLVKTVSAPGSVTIPSNVSINLNLQQKGSVGKVSQLTPQQMQILQRKQIPLQKNSTQKVNATPMLNAVQIIQQQGGRSLTVHQLNQLIKQHPQGLPQIIQTTPTIIATVTQSQSQPQITKVISTAGNIQTSQMQTIPVSATTISGIVTSATSGSPVVTLSQMPSLNISSIAPGQSSVTASIVKPGSITTQDGVTTVQIHPVSTLSQARVSAGLPQNVVVQPMQHVTMATPSASQHGGSAQQQVTLTSPVVMSQPIQVNVGGATPTQTTVQHLTVAHTPQAHITVTAQRSSSQTASPMTLTVTPTAAGQQGHVLTQAGVTYVTGGTGQTTSSGGQPATVSAEQAVTTILQQAQRQLGQAQGQQPQPTTISQTTPSLATILHVTTIGATEPAQTLLSGQQAGKTYSMRTRNQSQSK